MDVVSAAVNRASGILEYQKGFGVDFVVAADM